MNTLFKSKSSVMNNDVLKLVLKNLPLSDLLKLERCSKQFLNCVTELLSEQNELKISGKLGHYLGVKNFNITIVKENFTGNLIYYNGNINNSNLIFNQRIKKLLKRISNKCPNIQLLDIAMDCITKDFMDYILDRFPNIRYLKIRQKNFSYNNKIKSTVWKVIRKKIRNKLIYFCIDDKYMNVQKFIKLFKSFSMLKELTLNMTPSDINKLPFNSLSGLHKLYLNYIDVETIFKLKNLKNLTHLRFRTMKFDDRNEIFNSICDNLKQLEYLSIGSGEYSDVSGIKKLEYLKVLEIRISNSFEFKSNEFENLEELTLINITLSTRMLENLIDNTKHLKKLKLFDMRFICDCESNDLEICENCFKICLSLLPILKVTHLIISSNGKKLKTFESIPYLQNLRTIIIVDIYSDFTTTLLNSIIKLAQIKGKDSIILETSNSHLIKKWKKSALPKNLKTRVNKIKSYNRACCQWINDFKYKLVYNEVNSSF